jgi:hypothetical protein
MSAHSASTRRCIYCLETKPVEEFNKEHVLQDAFGRFAHGLTLICVCSSCNSEFGRTIDLALARDTVEAFDRFREGTKPPSEYRGFGAKSRMQQRFHDRPLHGAIATPTPVDGKLKLAPAPQIGFARTCEEEPAWFAIDRLPTKAELEAKGYHQNVAIRFQGVDPIVAVRSLAGIGYVVSKIDEISTQGVDRAGVDSLVERLRESGVEVGIVVETPRLAGTVTLVVEATVDRTVLRAIAKVALNYVARVCGPGYALLPDFNGVRRFVRWDAGEVDDFVTSIGPNQWRVAYRTGKVARGHYLGLNRHRDALFAAVSIHMRFWYSINLARGLALPTATAGHFLNLDTKTVERLATPLPLNPPTNFHDPRRRNPNSE